MKYLFLLLVAFSFGAFAHTEVCSQTTNVCASYHTDTEFSTRAEGRFSLFLTEKAELVGADLWMQMGSHGHGSRPLQIVPVTPGEFDVTKAYFVMRGTWQLRVTYKQGSQQETLIIPVTINN